MRTRSAIARVQLLLALGLVAAQTSSAQDSPTTQSSAAWEQDAPSSEAEPVNANSTPPPPSLLRFEELEFHLGFEAEWRRRETRYEAGTPFKWSSRQTDTSREFEETAGIGGSGSILDERFLQYQFDLRGGLSQHSFDEVRPGRDLHQSSQGDIFEYDVKTTLFPQGKLTANFFASQLDDRVPRLFQPSQDRRRERYGGELIFSDRILPMRLTYENSYEELTSTSRSISDNESRGDRRLNYEATWQPSEDHQLRLNYEYDDRRERYSGDRSRFDTSRNYVTLDHTLQFGADHRSRLETLLRFQDEGGDNARDLAEVSPLLRLQHTNEFATLYRAQYLQQAMDGAEVRQFRGEVGANYQPGQWFDASASIYDLKQEADADRDSNEWGGVATMAYRPENSLGRFGADLTYTHADVRVDPAQPDGVVLNESLTFKDPLPVYLARHDVRRASIIVTDAARTRTYLLGRDFTVTQSGRYTALHRLISGRITNNQTVLVSYLYRVDRGYQLLRDRVDARVQQEFKGGFTPYYAATIQNEDLDRRDLLSFEPRTINRHRLGFNFKQRTWNIGLEYEYNDDSIDPYRGVHANADAVLYTRGPHALSARGAYSFLDFVGTPTLRSHESSLADAGLTYQYLIDERLEANVAAAYRYEDDSLDGITHGIDVSAALNWKIGQFTAIFEVEYDELDMRGSNDGNVTVWLKLRRGFPMLAAK